MAYLLSLGLDQQGGKNSALTLVGAPLIPIITGGITYLEAKDGSSSDSPRTGIISFLVSFIFCYQALVFQITFMWPE